ncbi:MAG TPA: hypothetical protein VF748_07505 [Candidatus Acidoferrum sp.]
MLALFIPCTVPYGDKPSRGIKITCGKCAREEKTHLNYLKSGGQDDDDRVHLQARNKFEALGWRVGKSPSRHRCPQCINDARNARLRYLHANKDKHRHANRGAPTMPGNVVDLPKAEPPPKADPPREITRADRRVIFSKLEEVYDDELTGYQIGWTDERVAVDLGVPLAWVRLVRDDNFGPMGTNPEITKLLEEGQRWRGELVAILERATQLQEQTKRLADRGEIIERRLSEITKAVGK